MDFILENIRRIRREKNITQDYLSEKLGYKQTVWSKIESGQTPFPTNRIADVAKTLEVEIIDVVMPSSGCHQNNYEQKGGNAGVILIVNNFDKGFELIEKLIEENKKLSFQNKISAKTK